VRIDFPTLTPLFPAAGIDLTGRVGPPPSPLFSSDRKKMTGALSLSLYLFVFDKRA
jgi:hypothetical protein